MDFIYSPRPFLAEEKEQAIRSIIASAVPDRDFYVLVVGAVLLASCGIFLDSIPVLIASMIVAPLATPILGLGLGIAIRDKAVVMRSGAMLLAAVAVSLAFAMMISSATGGMAVREIDRIFISFIPNYFFDIAIALASGAIAAYGFIRPKVGSAMTGIGIAVSLMPPLVGTGIEWTFLHRDLAIAAGTVFLLNVCGILAASSVVFSLFGFRRVYRRMKMNA